MKILRGVGHCGFAMEFSVPYCTATGPAPIPTAAPNPEPNNEGTCGGTLRAPKGLIISEGYPRQYKTNQHCVWDIFDGSYSPTKVVKLTVKDIDVEYTGTCRYDWVQFKNADNSLISLGEGTAANQGKLCGEIIPPPIFSKTAGARVVFDSDDQVQKRGFKIEYEYVELETCTAVQLNTAIGVQPVTFTTLHYPSNYENDQSCDWIINVPEGQIVILVFDSFDTESNDKVQVFDMETELRLDNLSGRHTGFLKYTSIGNTMTVTFNSDSSGTKKGFRATATAVLPDVPTVEPHWNPLEP
jgi:hypothetical protein